MKKTQTTNNQHFDYAQCRQPTTNNQQPTTNNQQLTTNNQQPTTNNQQPTTNNQQPTTNNQQPITNWFEYPVKAQPHHTDYAGVVWHGTYVTWLEEARVEYLRSQGVEFADLVALGCDLPVVGLSLRYHKPIRLGMSALLKARLKALDKVRLNWDYRLESLDGDELYLTAQVTLVPVDREKGKILRRLPTLLKEALAIPPNPPYQRGE